MENTEYTTEYYKNKFGNEIKVNFSVDYFSTQASGSISCPAHAEAMMLSMYYDRYIPYDMFWEAGYSEENGPHWKGNREFFSQINKGVLYKPGHEQSLVHWFGQMQGIRPQ